MLTGCRYSDFRSVETMISTEPPTNWVITEISCWVHILNSHNANLIHDFASLKPWCNRNSQGCLQNWNTLAWGHLASYPGPSRGGPQKKWIPSYTLCLSSILLELHIMQNLWTITIVTRPVAMETPTHARAVCSYQALSPAPPTQKERNDLVEGLH